MGAGEKFQTWRLPVTCLRFYRLPSAPVLVPEARAAESSVVEPDSIRNPLHFTTFHDKPSPSRTL
jgi:hypothetical protein